MGEVIQHFRCSRCGNEEIIKMSEFKASKYEATVTCGGCGKKMVLVSEQREDDDGTEDEIPYGPITFLGL